MRLLLDRAQVGLALRAVGQPLVDHFVQGRMQASAAPGTPFALSPPSLGDTELLEGGTEEFSGVLGGTLAACSTPATRAARRATSAAASANSFWACCSSACDWGCPVRRAASGPFFSLPSLRPSRPLHAHGRLLEIHRPEPLTGPLPAFASQGHQNGHWPAAALHRVSDSLQQPCSASLCWKCPPRQTGEVDHPRPVLLSCAK